MESKKIISVGLLIIIIIISLVFSIWFTPISKEGLDVVRNPTDDDLNTMTTILNDSSKNNFTKIKQIYDIAKNYPILITIYTNLSTGCLTAISNYMKNAPIKDRDGINLDKYAVDKSRMEKINGILASKISPPEKIFEIKPYVCDEFEKCDNKLSTIYNNYEKIWINMLNGYVNQLNSDSGKNNKSNSSNFGNFNFTP
jgi:hypothetical protein